MVLTLISAASYFFLPSTPDNDANKVGPITLPDGMVMRSRFKDKANFLAGDFDVVISQLPQNKIPIYLYIQAEDLSVALKPLMKKFISLPTVVISNASEEDAERIVQNLKKLGCIVDYEPSHTLEN